jgi:hypothetical protein
MAERGYSLVSSRTSNGVTFEVWSESAEARKRRSLAEVIPANIEKRATDIQGWKCDTACAFQTNVPKANTSDCKSAYNELYNTVGVFTLPPGMCGPEYKSVQRLMYVS